MAEGTTSISKNIHFDLVSGLSKDIESLKRLLSNMRGMYYDNEALEKKIAKKDELIYEFYDPKIPEKDTEITFGTSITYPGLVGEEYYITKGDFNVELAKAEG